jgi:hypothetical protein
VRTYLQISGTLFGLIALAKLRQGGKKSEGPTPPK